MKKEALKKQLQEIAKMNKRQLIELAGKVSMSHLEEETTRTLNNALDLRLMELRGVDVSGLVVCSEFKAGEAS